MASTGMACNMFNNMYRMQAQLEMQKRQMDWMAAMAIRGSNLPGDLLGIGDGAGDRKAKRLQTLALRDRANTSIGALGCHTYYNQL